VIVRIMGEGQLSIDDSAVSELNLLDDKLEAALRGDNETAFHAALEALLAQARALGSPLPADALSASDLILPPAGATMDEVRELMSEDGLIPG
jgi:PspA-Associated protein